MLMALAALSFLSACGGNVTTSGVGCPGATGNFSNSSLAAGSQWVYTLSGWFIGSTNAYVPYAAAGTFTVDGRGNITAGFDDFLGGSFAGTYSIGGNGTGSVNVTVTSGTYQGLTMTWAITISNASPATF